MGNKCCSGSASHKDFSETPSQRNTVELLSHRMLRDQHTNSIDNDDPLQTLSGQKSQGVPTDRESPTLDKSKANHLVMLDEGYVKSSIITQFSKDDSNSQKDSSDKFMSPNRGLEGNSIGTPKYDQSKNIQLGFISDIKGSKDQSNKSKSSTPIYFSDEEQAANYTDHKTQENTNKSSNRFGFEQNNLNFDNESEIPKTQRYNNMPKINSIGENLSNLSGDFQSQLNSLHHSQSMKSITVITNPDSYGCFQQLSNNVYAHEWILKDIMDKKLISDSLHQNQFVVDLNQNQLDNQAQDCILKLAISQSSKFKNYAMTLPADFYEKQYFGCLYQFEDLKYYGKGSNDKLVIKAFFLNNQGYLDNEELLSQTVGYQSQILKLIDDGSHYPTVEEEIFIIDSSEDFTPLAYIVFIRQPSINMFQLVRDGWLRGKQQNQMQLLDNFSREKLIFYLLQTISLIIHLHQKGFSSFSSVIAENLYFDPIQQKVKFSSPFIAYLKPVNLIRGLYASQQIKEDSKQTKKQAKLGDQKQIGQTFYQICQLMQCKDSYIGSMLRDLVDTERNLSLSQIFKKYDQKLLEEDPLFYYKLGEQFYKERKLKASLDMLQVYEMIISSDDSNTKYKAVKNKLTNQDMKLELGLIYKILGVIYRETNDLNKALQSSQKALTLIGKSSNLEDIKRIESAEEKEELIKIKIQTALLKKQIGIQSEDHLPLNSHIAEVELNIALIYLQKQDYQRALYYLFRSYKQYLKINGVFHPSQQKILFMIAGILKEQKQVQEAIHYLERLNTIYNNHDNPKDYPDQLQVLGQLSQMHKERLRFGDSRKYNQNAIELIEKKIAQGKDISKLQPQFLAQLTSFYNNIATNLTALGIDEESIKYFEKSYQIAKLAFGESSEKTVNQLMNLGQAYLKLKQYQNAIQYLEQGIQQKVKLNLQIKPEQALIDKLKLCEAYKGMKNYEQCIILYTDLINFTQQYLPTRIEQLAAFNQELSESYLEVNDFLKGLEKIDESLKLYEKKIEKHHDIYIKALLLKGHIVLNLASDNKDDPLFKDVRQEIAQLIGEVFKKSKLFQEFSQGISEEIFDDKDSCSLLLEIFSPFEKEKLFQEARAKEKWRILVLETSYLMKSADE